MGKHCWILFCVHSDRESRGDLDAERRDRTRIRTQGCLRRKPPQVGPRMLARRGNLAAARVAEEGAGGRDEIYATGGFSDGGRPVATVEVRERGKGTSGGEGERGEGNVRLRET